MTPTWPELIMLMTFGPAQGSEPGLRGTVRTRELCDDELRDSVFHVVARGEFARIEAPNGEPLIIFGARRIWTFSTDPPTEYDRATASFGWQGAELVRREPLSRWEGSDFTKPTGPITATTFLGRAAWEVELAPPSHKPYPLQLTVDAVTGLLLRQANRDFGTVTEWLELEVGAELADELFSWVGVTQPPPDREAEHEADLAARRAWLAAQGIGELALTVRPRLALHVWDETTGAFHASIHTVLSGSVLRRPHTDEPWDEVDQMGWPNVVRWSDDRWDWAIAGGAELDSETIAELRRGLDR